MKKPTAAGGEKDKNSEKSSKTKHEPTSTMKSSKKKTVKGGCINGRPIGSIGKPKKTVTFTPSVGADDADRAETVEHLAARMKALNEMAQFIAKNNSNANMMESWATFQRHRNESNRLSTNPDLKSVTKSEFEILKRLTQEAKMVIPSDSDDSGREVEEVTSDDEASETEDGEIKVYTQRRRKKSKRRNPSPVEEPLEIEEVEEIPSQIEELPQLTPVVVSPSAPMEPPVDQPSTSGTSRRQPPSKRAKIVAPDSAPSSPLLMSKNPERAQVKHTLRKAQSKLNGMINITNEKMFL